MNLVCCAHVKIVNKKSSLPLDSLQKGDDCFVFTKSQLEHTWIHLLLTLRLTLDYYCIYIIYFKMDIGCNCLKW